jgi:hypothetical protein
MQTKIDRHLGSLGRQDNSLDLKDEDFGSNERSLLCFYVFENPFKGLGFPANPSDRLIIERAAKYVGIKIQKNRHAVVP